MAEHVIAVSTYGSYRVKNAHTGQMVSAQKIGYSSAASAVLLALYGDRARDVSSKQASYHYIQIDAEVTVRHGYILLKVSDAELASAEAITRQTHRPAVYRWQDNAWVEFPSLKSPDYVPVIGRSGPGFNPTGMRIVAAATGEAEAAVAGILVEKTQRSATDTPWFWLRGDTYPHRETLKRWGCRWSKKRKSWYYIGANLPDAVQQLIEQVNAPSDDNVSDDDHDPCSVEEAAVVLGLRVKDTPTEAPATSDGPPRLFDLSETVYVRHDLATPDGQHVPTGTQGTITRLYNRNPTHGWSSDPNDPDRQVKKTTIRLKPSTTLTLLADDGTLVEMDGDDALLEFITRNKRSLAAYLNNKFSPAYQFDMNGIRRFLDRVRLKGKYPLYAAQKHVIAAITKGFERRDSILLVGQMGTGKTAMGSTSAIAIASGAVKVLADDIHPDQVTLVVCPPHLIEKWKRELLSIHPNMIVERIDRHEQMKAFMDKAARVGAGIPKIGLIKRDLTKLGASREVAVVWRNEPVALWRHDQPTPEGYEPNQRIFKQRVPKCPHCGATVMQERKGTSVPASENWLKSGKRSCGVCQTPLWQEARDRGSRPKPGHKYPPKNPRYRLDEYIKRQYGERIYLLIWDEIHEAANGDTGNGEAFGRLAGVAKKILAMTGTPFNGKASSLFNIEYHLNERVRQRYPWGGADRLSRKERGSSRFQTVIDATGKQRGRAESSWVSDMGVREQVVEERPTYDSNTGAYTGTSTYERPYEEAPGISPLLVAEVLDHAIFFSLADLGKALPQYEEIALPVEMDTDTYDQYDRTRALLKDYLVQRRWEGDTTFRGAYLQWSMGWINTPFRPTEVIHNIKHPITGEKRPHVVTRIPSYGEDRVYTKEQALVDLLKKELAAGRPCVVYLRQTATKDIQPRIESLIRQHVPGAVPYVLKNTVAAERREKVIDQQIAAGVNVVICNPELVKTGLDLIFFPTLIFAEITFNLSTMMQAAARAYRLNQTHEHCKTVYLFAEGTMEHTAVQLMSRKQRAAKLLTGDIGLTGLDALTEGESGFEEALLNAIAKDESLLDPSEMFKVNAGQNEIDAEDAAYWNVEVGEDEVEEPALVAHADPVVGAAIELGGVLVEDDQPRQTPRPAVKVALPERLSSDTARLVRYVGSYLDGVHLIHDRDKRLKLQAKLLTILTDGVIDNEETRTVVGLRDPDFGQYPVHEETLIRHVRGWLKQHRFVFTGCEDEAAARIVDLAKQAFGLTPVKLDIFEKLEEMRDEELQRELAVTLKADRPAASAPAKQSKRKRKKLDLLAVPEEKCETVSDVRPLAPKRRQPEADEHVPQQLTMF